MHRSQERRVMAAEDKVRKVRESKTRLVYKKESLKLVFTYAYILNQTFGIFSTTLLGCSTMYM